MYIKYTYYLSLHIPYSIIQCKCCELKIDICEIGLYVVLQGDVRENSVSLWVR